MPPNLILTLITLTLILTEVGRLATEQRVRGGCG